MHGKTLQQKAEAATDKLIKERTTNRWTQSGNRPREECEKPRKKGTWKKKKATFYSTYSEPHRISRGGIHRVTVVILYSVLNRMKGSIKKKGYSYLQRVYLQRGVTFKMLVGAHSQPIKRQNVLEAIMKRFFFFFFTVYGMQFYCIWLYYISQKTFGPRNRTRLYTKQSLIDWRLFDKHTHR